MDNFIEGKREPCLPGLKDIHNSTPKSKWRLPLLILAVFSLCITVMRLHTYNEPRQRDISSHAVIAHGLLTGRSLYSDLWDSKPPAVFLTYAAGEILFGYGPRAIYFLGVAAAIITLLGVYRAGSACGGTAGGLWASAFWTAICSDIWLHANDPNIEVFINACLAWAFALILRAKPKKLKPVRWLTIGALFALATLYKTVAIVFPVFLCGIYLLINMRDSQMRKIAFLQVCMAATVGVVAWTATIMYFTATDRLPIFYKTFVTYGRWYTQSKGTGILNNITAKLNYIRFSTVMKSTSVLIIFAIAGTTLGLLRGRRRYWALLLAFALATHFAVALPGRFYKHYYQLWLVPLVIGSGWTITIFTLKNKLSSVLLRNIAGAIGLIIILCSVLPQYELSADEWSIQKWGRQYIVSREVARELDKMLKPAETFYLWGMQHGLYFWSKRSPPAGAFWSIHLVEDSPLAQKLTARTLKDLEREKPEIFIERRLDSRLRVPNRVRSWALEQRRYIPLPGNPNRGRIKANRFLYRIYIRRDGKLAARLGM